MDMIERVARAICRQTNIAMEGVTEVVLDNPDFVIPGSRRFDKTDTPRWKLYIPQARAAIEAMHEPTDEMLGCGERVLGETGSIRDVYVAMTHAAFSREYPY